MSYLIQKTKDGRRDIYVNSLKKLLVEDIEQMREMKSQGLPDKVIAKAFNVWGTTVSHWTGDIEPKIL